MSKQWFKDGFGLVRLEDIELDFEMLDWCKIGVKSFRFECKYWAYFSYWRNAKSLLPIEIKGKA